MSNFFSNSPIWSDKGLAVVRIIFGLLLMYHGFEVFNPEVMKGYTQWENFNTSFGSFMVYAGKSSEFIAGLCLVMGLFTRIAAVITILTFLYITFVVASGKFWYEDQHPFMFALFGLLFFFTGAGAWSVDAKLMKKKGS